MKNCSVFFLIIVVLFPFIIKGQIKKICLEVNAQESLMPAKASLFFVGSLNNWNPSDDNFHFKQISPGKYVLNIQANAGIYEFKVTRGSWETVESTINGKPVANHTIVLKNDTLITLNISQWQDNFKPQPRTHTASKQVKIIDTAFYMPQLDRKRRVWIYLPQGYENSKKYYPVIYMHDGQNLFDSYTSGYGEWGVDEILDSLANLKKPMVIIVGVDHGDQYRLTEYNPYKNEKFGKGRGDDYVDFLANTLKPHIDAHYRTKADAKNTTIAGSSMGGIISLYALAKYPKIFGNVGIFSPALWITPELMNYISSKKLSSSRIYFVAGSLEGDTMIPDMKCMYEILLQKRISKENLYYKVSEDGKHSEWFWHREFPNFYKWIFK